MSIKRIILLDGNPPWVRSLMRAVAGQGVEVEALRPQMMFRSTPLEEVKEAGFHQAAVAIPGWSRFGGTSTRILKRRIRRLGKADAIVFTLPHYAGVAEGVSGCISAYFAHDPFKFYDWDQRVTAAREQRMLDRCDIVFAIAEALAEDFRKITRTRVETMPNAVSRGFIERLREGPAGPGDMGGIGRPIVGCVGQLNQAAYDWGLVTHLARSMPPVSFVFVGPIFEKTATIQAVLDLPNVRWMGARPHEELPGYLNAFDICFNPLLPGEHSDRRSPLRLYDYLATDKPILSTDVREAHSHRPFVEIGRNGDECVAMVRRVISGGYSQDIEGRRRYIEENTWDRRAGRLLEYLESVKK